jgi:hypothetical protein
MRTQQSFFKLISLIVAGGLALSAAVVSTRPVLTAQMVATPRAISTFATQRDLRVRFHQLWLRTARSYNEWERGLWTRGPLLTAEYAHRAALVRFLRTELVPYLANERTVVYPVADVVLSRSHNLTAAAISDSRAIEGFVERLDATARFPDGRAFRDNAYALSIAVDNYFTKDHRVIQQLVALGPRTDARRVAMAGR